MLLKISLLRPICSVLFSALFSYGIAQAMFTRTTLHWLYKIHGIWPFQSLLIVLGDSEQKLQKMHSLWNPPEHPFPSLAYALFVHWTVQIILNAKERQWNAIPGGQKQRRPIGKLFIASAVPVGFYVALCVTFLSLCAQRVSEMHSLVITLQFVHSFVTCVMTTFVLIISRKWEMNGEGK